MVKKLDIDLDAFPFYQRESYRGKILKNKCGRDFLFYALAYLKLTEGKRNILSPLDLNAHFGIEIPAWLAWSQIQFFRMPRYLQKEGYQLLINKNRVSNFLAFVRANLFSRIPYEAAIREIEKGISEHRAVGIDISVGFGGLLDHVMFVYGFDKDNLYIFETTKTPISYETVSDSYRQLKRLPKHEIRKRWTRFGRIWEVVKR